jgi:sortase A
MVTGCVLLLLYAAWQTHAYVMFQAGLLSFRAHQLHSSDAPAAKAQQDNSKINFTFWSEKRVQAYKNALAMKLETPIAVLSIPKIGIEVPVFDGTDGVTLNRGAGRIEGTAGPGEVGNIGIAAHRDGFFRRLKDIHVGDRVELSASGARFVYAVEEIVIVPPTDVSVLRPRPQPSLTLVTCYPFYFVGDAPQRYIVHASLVDKETATTSSLKSAVQHNEREDMP